MTTHPIVRSIALAAVCLLAANLSSRASYIPVPDFSFDTSGPNYSGSSYADQTTNGWGYDSLPYGTGVGEPFNGWLTAAANYQIYSVSTAGDSGSFNGANAVRVNGNAYYGYTLESLTPVVSSIENNVTWLRIPEATLVTETDLVTWLGSSCFPVQWQRLCPSVRSASRAPGWWC